MTILTDFLGWFTLEIPEGWDFETDDGVTTLRDPSGVGLAYVSAGRHVGGRQAGFGGPEFLARFLESLGVAVHLEAIEGFEGPGCRIYSYRRRTETAHWSYWSVTDDETVLLISYTCKATDADRDLPKVDEMVRSARLYHSVPN
jgi:hypothetical protein